MLKISVSTRATPRSWLRGFDGIARFRGSGRGSVEARSAESAARTHDGSASSAPLGILPFAALDRAAPAAPHRAMTAVPAGAPRRCDAPLLGAFDRRAAVVDDARCDLERDAGLLPA